MPSPRTAKVNVAKLQLQQPQRPGPSAPVACNLCSEPGHKSPACPFQADAKTAATAAAKAARRKASAHATKKKATPALIPTIYTDVENSDGGGLSGMVTVGLDSMSDHHLVNRRDLFLQKTIKPYARPITVEGATGETPCFEYGDVYLNNVLIKGAIFCPNSPYNLFSVGRLFREHPSWDWGLSKLGPSALALRAIDDSGALVLAAVTEDDLMLSKCYLGPRPRAVAQPPPGADGYPRRGARAVAHALPVTVHAAAPASGLTVPAPSSTDSTNVPLRLPPDSEFWEFAWWHRALGHPSLRTMHWYLKTYPHLNFGKMPSSLSCTACDEGKPHRAAIRAVRISGDPFAASKGDCASLDVKVSPTPGYDGCLYTTIIVSHRTKYVWVLHPPTKDALAALIRKWYIAYSVQHSAVSIRQ